MWKNFLFSLPLIMCSNLLAAQELFNQRVHFDYAAAVLSGIYVTDSCFYTTGLMSDTMPPYYPNGLLWAKYDLAGELQDYTYYFEENNKISNWYADLQPYMDGFITSAEIQKDTGKCVGLFYFDKEGNIDHSIRFSYFFPLHERSFIQHTRPAIGPDKKVLLPTRERNPIGTNNTETVLQLFDSTGTMLWRKNYGEVHGDRKDYPVNVVSSGNDFIVSCWYTNGNIVMQNYTPRHYIFAVDTAGNVLWEYYSPIDSLLAEPRALLAEEDGSLIVGSVLGEEFYIDPDFDGLLWRTAYIYKLNPPDEIEWAVSFKELYPTTGVLNSLRKIIKVSDGSGYVLTGHYARADEAEGGDVRGWLIKITPEGDSLWSRELRFLSPTPDSDFHELYDVEETPDGGFLMCGQVIHYNSPPPIQQGWLIKVDAAGCLVPGCDLVPTQEPGQRVELSLKLYPNPASELLYIFLQDSAIAQREQAILRLVNQQGQLVQSYSAGRVDEVTHILSVNHLTKGGYFLQYIADGKILASEPVIVQ